MDTFLTISVLVGFWLGLRLLARSFDRDRIRTYLKQRGSTLIAATWAPFGTGWLGERGDRIYRIRYADASGAIREALCKTRSLSGVYFSEDQPAPKPEAPSTPWVYDPSMDIEQSPPESHDQR
ncbi:MAG: hypothetical protein ABI411_14260 [Tahibacter sp.]